MDVSHDPRDIAAHFGRLVDDLRRLLAFHGLRSGTPQHLAAFARKLEDSKPFRTDFTSMLRSTRDLEQGRLTSDQMLSIVAFAVGGEALLDDPSSSPATTHTIALVLMLLAGIGGWSDTGDHAAPEPARTLAERPPAPLPTPALRFATADSSAPPVQPANAAPAIDVRAFLRSESRPSPPTESRPDVHSITGAEPFSEHDAEPRPQPRHDAALASPEARPEPRPDPHHIIRREPLSEVVRPPAPQGTATAPRADAPRNPPHPPPETPRRSEPMRAAAAHPQRWPEPRSASDGWRPPDHAPRTPQAQTSPERQPVPQAPRESTTPSRLAAAAADDHRRSARSTTPAPATYSPTAAVGTPAQHTASRATPSAQIPAASAPAQNPDDVDEWIIDHPAPTEAPSRPPSRKLTLNAALALAAVALLAFGLFEGLHSRHIASPAYVSVPPTPQPAIRPAATEPSIPAGPNPSTDAALPADVAPPSSRASRTAATAPALAPSRPPRQTAPSEDLPPPATVPQPRVQPEQLTPRPIPKAAAPPSSLEATSLPIPSGPVPVPEATMNRQLIAAHKPVYPPAALADRVQGTVVLRAFVSTDGSIRRTDVLTGPAPLINSALAAATWRRYRPFLIHGHPVEVQTEVTLHYVLPDANP